MTLSHNNIPTIHCDDDDDDDIRKKLFYYLRLSLSPLTCCGDVLHNNIPTIHEKKIVLLSMFVIITSNVLW